MTVNPNREMIEPIVPFALQQEVGNYSEQISQLFSYVTNTISEATGLERVLISLLDANSFSVVGSIGFDHHAYPIKNSFCEIVLHKEDIVIISDTLTDPKYKDHPKVVSEPFIRSYIGYPIFHNGQVVGVVCAFSSEPVEFDETIGETLRHKANMVGIAIAADRLTSQFEIEHRLVSEAPISCLLIDAKPGWPVIFASDNCFSLLGIPSPDSISDFKLDKHIATEDRITFKDSLNYHRITPLIDLETEYQVELADGSYKNIRQVSSSEYDAQGNLSFVRLYLIDQTDQKDLELRLRSVKERSSLVIDSLDLGTWDYSVASEQYQVNQRWYEMIGLNLEEQESAADILRTRVHPLDKQRVLLEIEELIAGKREEINQNYRIKHNAGHWIWVSTFGKTVEYNDKGKPSRIIGTKRDVTESYEAAMKKQKQDALVALMSQAQQVFLKESDLRKACSSIFDALVNLAESDFGFIGERITLDNQKPALKIQAITDISWDASSRELYSRYLNDGLVFENLNNLFGQVILTETEVVSNDVPKHKHSSGTPHGHPDMDCFLGLPIKFDGVVYGMIGFANRVVGYDRELIDFLSPLLDNLGLLMKVRGIDAARAAAEDELKELATTDELTNLPNRRAFCGELDHILNRYKRYKTDFCVAIFDIDHFKQVNDTHGHDGGDAVLQQFSELVVEHKREIDVVGRIGGEEFALIMPDTSQKDALLACERIRKALAKHKFNLNDGTSIKVTTSIGLSIVVANDKAQETIIKRADEALYEAKEQGRNKTVVAN
ncbi:MAG: diguanylate cyclase [Glaciecola sp.]